MNIHPIFVHFPIALFTVYAILEIVRIKKIQQSAWIAPTKTVLLTFGIVFAQLSLMTGEAAEHLIAGASQSLRALIEMHATFAALSTWIFAVAAFAYLAEYVLMSPWFTTVFARWGNVGAMVTKVLAWYSGRLMKSWLRIVCAVVGLITITVAGALGGAIVYGPDVDPVVSFIYSLFF